jgi:hypothetical protein
MKVYPDVVYLIDVNVKGKNLPLPRHREKLMYWGVEIQIHHS